MSEDWVIYSIFGVCLYLCGLLHGLSITWRSR
jgi:hypothetical protein